eukprot:PhM_4_TR3778/c1_g1_i1/m.8426
MEQGSNNNKRPIRVFVRVRPTLRYMTDDLATPSASTEAALGLVPIRTGPNVVQLAGDSPHHFDGVFPQDSTHDDVFRVVGDPALADCLRGYHSTVFVYGQTGSGKTFTVNGGQHTRHGVGLVQDVGARLFSIIEAESDESEYNVSLEYVQIYQECIQDLICPELTNLQIRESPDTGIFVRGASQTRIETLQDMLETYSRADHNRVTAPTLSNATSSRSHSVLTLNVHYRRKVTRADLSMSSPLDSTLTDRRLVRRGRLHIVDLAGSERLKKTQSEGVRRDEARTINASLSALGNVMHALTDAKATHVPYRDSKLTRLLSESLGGLGVCSVVVTLAPGWGSLAESRNSLAFGSRAMEVKNRPVAFTALDEKSRMIEAQNWLEERNHHLETRVRELEDQLTSASGPASQPPHVQVLLDTLKDKDIELSHMKSESAGRIAQLEEELERAHGQIASLLNDVAYYRDKSRSFDDSAERASTSALFAESKLEGLRSENTQLKQYLEEERNTALEQTRTLAKIRQAQRSMLDEFGRTMAVALEDMSLSLFESYAETNTLLLEHHAHLHTLAWIDGQRHRKVASLAIQLRKVQQTKATASEASPVETPAPNAALTSAAALTRLQEACAKDRDQVCAEELHNRLVVVQRLAHSAIAAQIHLQNEVDRVPRCINFPPETLAHIVYEQHSEMLETIQAKHTDMLALCSKLALHTTQISSINRQTDAVHREEVIQRLATTTEEHEHALQIYSKTYQTLNNQLINATATTTTLEEDVAFLNRRIRGLETAAHSRDTLGSLAADVEAQYHIDRTAIISREAEHREHVVRSFLRKRHALELCEVRTSVCAELEHAHTADMQRVQAMAQDASQIQLDQALDYGELISREAYERTALQAHLTKALHHLALELSSQSSFATADMISYRRQLALSVSRNFEDVCSMRALCDLECRERERYADIRSRESSARISLFHRFMLRCVIFVPDFSDVANILFDESRSFVSLLCEFVVGVLSAPVAEVPAWLRDMISSRNVSSDHRGVSDLDISAVSSSNVSDSWQASFQRGFMMNSHSDALLTHESSTLKSQKPRRRLSLLASSHDDDDAKWGTPSGHRVGALSAHSVSPPSAYRPTTYRTPAHNHNSNTTLTASPTTVHRSVCEIDFSCDGACTSLYESDVENLQCHIDRGKGVLGHLHGVSEALGAVVRSDRQLQRSVLAQRSRRKRTAAVPT